MRYLFVLVMALAGCVKSPPLAPSEQCATQGMVLSSMTIGSGSTNARARVGDGTVYARAESSDESVTCRRAESGRDFCEVAAFAQSARTKDGFDTGWRNALIGAGYVAYIVPGLILYLVFESQSGDTRTDADSAAAGNLRACRQTHRPPPP